MEGPAPDRAHARLSARGAVLIAAVAACSLAAAACGRAVEQDPAADRAEQTAEAEAGEVVLTPETAREGRRRLGERPRKSRSRARAVELEGAGEQTQPGPASSADAPSPERATDAQVRAELREAQAALSSFKQHLATTAYLPTGPRARVLPDGTAVAPEDAPDVVKRVILAGNQIAKFPYKWGGGHGAWRDTGYDCSGSVSFALAGAGLLRSPAHLGRLHRLRRVGTGGVDHDLHQPRARLHAGGRAALRHQRPGPRGHALAGAAGGRVRGPSRPGVVGLRAQPAEPAATAKAAPRPNPNAGTGAFGGGAAPGCEFSSASRVPHSM